MWYSEIPDLSLLPWLDDVLDDLFLDTITLTMGFPPIRLFYGLILSMILVAVFQRLFHAVRR